MSAEQREQPAPLTLGLTDKAREHWAQTERDRQAHNDRGCRCPLCDLLVAHVLAGYTIAEPHAPNGIFIDRTYSPRFDTIICTGCRASFSNDDEAQQHLDIENAKQTGGIR